MAHSVIWSKRALDDVDALAEYIARDSEAYARTVVQAIVGVGHRLRQFPFSGRIVREAREATIREIVVYNYRVIYRAQSEAVSVLAVVHGSQQLIRGHFEPGES